MNKTDNAKTVTFGNDYYLTPESCTSLGNYKDEDFESDEQGKLAKILRKLKPLTANVNFKDFELKEMGGHHYLCSTASDGDSVGTEHIGSFRISI